MTRAGKRTESVDLNKLPIQLNSLRLSHPLHFTWHLWVLTPDRNKGWEECLHEAGSISTVEDFWSVLNRLQPASLMAAGGDYFLFKEGIKPTWDDPANVKGGRWFIPLDRLSRGNKLDNYWVETAMAMVGEQFGQDNDQICGAVVSLRFRTDKVSLWTRDAGSLAGKQANQRIGEMLKNKLKLQAKEREEMRFEEHREASKRSLHKPSNSSGKQ